MTEPTLEQLRTGQNNRIDRILYIVKAELEQATRKFGSFNSTHEGYAVILEELDELWEVIRTKEMQGRETALVVEAVQVAAMAVRFLLDMTSCGEAE